MKSSLIRVHLGCFNQPVAGWINTDVTPHIWVARIPFAAELLYKTGRITAARYEDHRRGVFRRVRRLDLVKTFPFPDESAEAVFSSHVLEHLPLDVAASALSEMHRILVPGGVCRISVPDLDKVIADFDPLQPDATVYRIFESRQAQDANRHHWMYNNVSLASALRNAGFKTVTRANFQTGQCPDLEFLDNREEESLFMEAIR